MILDANLLLFDGTTTATTATSTTSSDMIDLGEGAYRNLNKLRTAFCVCTTDMEGSTSNTLTASILGCDTATGTFNTWHSGKAITAPTAGAVLLDNVSLDNFPYRFLKLQVTASGTCTTAPKVTGGINANDVPVNQKSF